MSKVFPNNGRESRRIVNAILAKTNKEDEKEVKKLLRSLENEMYDSHLTIFSTTVKWLARNIKTLVDAKRLTGGNFKNSMDLINLLNRARKIGLAELKVTVAVDNAGHIYTTKHFDDSEPEPIDRKELKEVFENYLD